MCSLKVIAMSSTAAAAGIFLAACSGGSGSGTPPVLPDVAAATFVPVIDNQYLPMPIGATWTIQATTDEGVEVIEIMVLSSAKTIQGVTATVVRDTARLDGVLIEDTYDWYAQDSAGNVWYLGEDTCEYVNDVCVSTAGSWEWGVDGALPGIVMPGAPAVDGQPYYQEYYVGEAEDVGEVVAVGEAVTVPAGSFTGCVKTRDTSTLTSDKEFKYYCPGVGNALIEEGGDREELMTYSIP